MSITDIINPTSNLALDENAWGFSLTGSTNSWQAVPALSVPQTIKSTNTPTVTTGDTTDIFYGTRVNHTIPAGEYKGHVVITVVVN